jgi:hypothetical protein
VVGDRATPATEQVASYFSIPRPPPEVLLRNYRSVTRPTTNP